MDLKKASLLFYFLIFLNLRQHFVHAISRSTTSVKPNHDNLTDGDTFAGISTELAAGIKKGGGGGRGGFGGGGRSFGGGGRSFGGGGGGRSYGGGGGGGNGGGGRKGGGRGIGGVGGIHPIPIYSGGSYGSNHGGHHRSSSGRESVSVWLGLSILIGLVFVS